MELTWFGHSAFALAFGESRILIDPFLKGNPSFAGQDFEVAIKGTTHIALTHGHGDHTGDVIEIAKATGAVVMGNADLCTWLAKRGVEKVDPGNTGGTLHHDGFSMTFVRADHSSGDVDETGMAHGLGNCNGLIFKIDGAPTVYHLGDTDIFSDMALIAELYEPNVGLVPIGDRFTMDARLAATACERFLNLDLAIPCHYGTFPLIAPNADDFVARCEAIGQKVAVMTPGQTITL